MPVALASDESKARAPAGVSRRRASRRGYHRSFSRPDGKKRRRQKGRPLFGAALLSATPKSGCQSTSTGAPTGTRSYRSMTSSFIIRMQPDETFWPMVQGSLVPWMRYIGRAEIERAGAERIVGAAVHVARQVGPALHHCRRRRPARPFRLAADRLVARPGEARAADADAVAHGAARRGRPDRDNGSACRRRWIQLSGPWDNPLRGAGTPMEFLGPAGLARARPANCRRGRDSPGRRRTDKGTTANKRPAGSRVAASGRPVARNSMKPPPRFCAWAGASGAMESARPQAATLRT